jgi:hypothetical protein
MQASGACPFIEFANLPSRTEFLPCRLRHKSLSASSVNQAAGRKPAKIPRGFMPASGKMAFKSRISGFNRRQSGIGWFT